ncbi:cytochrome o ubiquinol oxidase subunit IV [Sphingomonas sp. DG1-23]|uniref:cytochrome o ubiquinol oxidase subunit IV n=1 Tax=Sphingomonas sp. DG1-23 TaxID=3068316 RepID=UPI00273E9AE8|nr:cytochrome o ubiquinol oxidase subunit IV [Sphingomonas sp. DG1-23]MDP5280051.1 cytochrome o ubiquinol oxidase subunit IV [Sphingomonas sp. DG1-23]
MNDAVHAPADHGHHDTQGHGAAHAPLSRRGYVIGFLISVVLTAIPFWLVMTGVLQDAQTTAIIIVAFAVAQIIVHTVAFLHVNTRSEGGWTLLAYIFTGVIVLIVIAGSLWIMYHINSNMMPMPSAEMSAQP